MSLYSIKSETLTSIGDAIRAKGGTSDAIPVTSLADAITNLPSSGGGGDIEIPTQVIVSNSDSSFFFAGDRMKWVLDLLPDNQTMEFVFTDIWNTDTGGMIDRCTGDYSKFTLSVAKLAGGLGSNTVTKLPTIKFHDVEYMTGGAQLFGGSSNLRNIPRDYLYPYDENGNKLSAPHPNAFGGKYGIWTFCQGCYNLRNLPELPTYLNFMSSISEAYGAAFYECYSLDKIEGLPVFPESKSLTWNGFSDTFAYCKRISEMTFQVQPDGTPYKCNWSNQFIDLWNAGYGFAEAYCNEYNGLSKNDERYLSASGWVNENIHIERPDDWWAGSAEFSRYNHDSAVRTINSLPDCSAGSGNTIKFRRDCGYATGPDGTNNSVGTLTEAEIAVATAKGWTVTFN